MMQWLGGINNPVHQTRDDKPPIDEYAISSISMQKAPGTYVIPTYVTSWWATFAGSATDRLRLNTLHWHSSVCVCIPPTATRSILYRASLRTDHLDLRRNPPEPSRAYIMLTSKAEKADGGGSRNERPGSSRAAIRINTGDRIHTLRRGSERAGAPLQSVCRTTRSSTRLWGWPEEGTAHMASGDPVPALPHDEQAAPPPGMYWVQMQGLWALRPTVDIDSSFMRSDTNGHTESLSRATLEQEEPHPTGANQQKIAQSAGVACSAAALTALTSAAEGGSRMERLARTQGVIGPPQIQHMPSARLNGGPEQRQEGDVTARLQPQAPTPPLPPPPQPAHVPEQQHQGWPDWFLQWAHRVREGPDHPPGSSAPPSAPITPPSPSPPGTQRSTVSKPLLAASPCGPAPLRRPAHSLRAMWVRLREPLPLGSRSAAAVAPWCPPNHAGGHSPVFAPSRERARFSFCPLRWW